jgi:hypothetical protein
MTWLAPEVTTVEILSRERVLRMGSRIVEQPGWDLCFAANLDYAVTGFESHAAGEGGTGGVIASL